MHRLSCRFSDIIVDKIVIYDQEQHHHLKNVLRLKTGEKVMAFDENGNLYACVIAGLKDKISLDIINRVPVAKKSGIKLTLACAIPKKSRFDDIVDKLVQLGVHRIIPLKTERVIVKLDKHKSSLRLERWKKIILSASKQSQRSDLTVIDPVKSLKEVITASAEFDLRLIPYLEGERKSLKDVLDKFFRDGVMLNGHKNRTVPNMIVLIGPEGDFSGQEVSLAKAAGFIPITLGDLVLRVDSAAIAVASFIRFYAHD